MTLSFIKNNKKVIMAIAIVLCLALIGGLFAIIGNINASADDTFNDVNPVLTLEEIDSNLEADFYSKGLYKQETTFTQSGNGAEGGTYHLNSNAYCVWSKIDDVAFAYKAYPVSNTGNDFIEAEVTIPRKATPTGKGGSATKNDLHGNSSIGIMLRSGLEPDDAEVFIHLRGATVLVVYRPYNGEGTKVQYTGMSLSFPCKLKLRKQGNQVTLWYQHGKIEYQKFNYPVAFTEPGPVYIGLASHSCDEATWIDADFKDFKVNGLGTWNSEGDGGDTTPSKTPSIYKEVDTPVTSNTLLRETFTDGDITGRRKNTVTTPIWETKLAPTLENIDGNMVWHRNFLDEANYVGAELGTWCDYEVSAEVQFTENCDPNPDNAQNMFALLARHTEIPYYGACDYALVIRNGHKLYLQKRIHQKNTVDEIQQLNDFSGSVLLGEVFDLRTLEGNEYYADVKEYFLTEDKTIDTSKTYYTFSKSMGYSAVSTPVASELATYYEAKIVKSSNNSWTCLGDGVFHKMKIRVFDNIITGYWDGKEILRVVDDIVMPGWSGSRSSYTMVITKGEVGIATYETDCYVDNIIVTDLNDPLGGDYDNYIEGNWNQAVPSYLESWTNKTGVKYMTK